MDFGLEGGGEGGELVVEEVGEGLGGGVAAAGEEEADEVLLDGVDLFDVGVVPEGLIGEVFAVLGVEWEQGVDGGLDLLFHGLLPSLVSWKVTFQGVGGNFILYAGWAFAHSIGTLLRGLLCDISVHEVRWRRLASRMR